MKTKFLSYILIIVTLSCNKKDQKFGWNGHYILPISVDTLNAAKILGFDQINLSNDETHCIYNNSLEFFKLEQNDILPELNFSLSDTLEIPSLIYGISFPPGFEIWEMFNLKKLILIV